MNVNAFFVAMMVLIGAAVGVLLSIRPQWNFFPFMPYFSVLVAMAVIELGLMFTGKLRGPLTIEVRLAGLVLGIVASAIAAPALTALAK